MIGRVLREQLRIANQSESAIEVSQRIADAHAREAVHDDMRRRFYPLTADNVQAALDYQAAGLRELDRMVP